MINHFEINEKKKPTRSEDVVGSSWSAQSLLLFRSETDGAVVAVHHGHRHRTVLHHETSEASHQLPRFPSGCVVGNGGVKSDAVGIAELVAEPLLHFGFRGRRSDDVPYGDLDLDVGHVVVRLAPHDDCSDRIDELGMLGRADHGIGERQGLAWIVLPHEGHGGIATPRTLPGGVSHDLLGGTLLVLGKNGLLHDGHSSRLGLGFRYSCDTTTKKNWISKLLCRRNTNHQFTNTSIAYYTTPVKLNRKSPYFRAFSGFLYWIKKFSSPKMLNREFVFTPKIEYKLVAERSEANQNSLTLPVWCCASGLNHEGACEKPLYYTEKTLGFPELDCRHDIDY